MADRNTAATAGLMGVCQKHHWISLWIGVVARIADRLVSGRFVANPDAFDAAQVQRRATTQVYEEAVSGNKLGQVL